MKHLFEAHRRVVEQCMSQVLLEMSGRVLVKEFFEDSDSIPDEAYSILDHARRRLVNVIRGLPYFDVVAVGKASHAMFDGFCETLGSNKINEAIVVSHTEVTEEIRAKYGSQVRFLSGAHPLPDIHSRLAAQQIFDFVIATLPTTPLVVLLSGGASSLIFSPLPPLRLSQSRELFDLLLKGGTPIHELNIVRRFCSLLGGGTLRQICPSRNVYSFIISDVPGDLIEDIGSAPTDGGSRPKFEHVWEVLQKWLPPSSAAVFSDILAHIEHDYIGEPRRIIKGSYDTLTINELIGSNEIALKKITRILNTMGCKVVHLEGLSQGLARSLAGTHLAQVDQWLKEKGGSYPRKVAFISGGEATVEVKGKGRGGRNQEFVLACVPHIAGKPITVASFASDGIDGNSPAAGAIANGYTMERARAEGLNVQDYLENNDSYSFFHILGDTLMTGPTDTNVMDFRIILVNSET